MGMGSLIGEWAMRYVSSLNTVASDIYKYELFDRKAAMINSIARTEQLSLDDPFMNDERDKFRKEKDKSYARCLGTIVNHLLLKVS